MNEYYEETCPICGECDITTNNNNHFQWYCNICQSNFPEPKVIVHQLQSTLDKDYLESINNKIYDTESIQIDMANKNFNPENLEDYNHVNIVKNSLIDGQRNQAYRQAKRFGLDIADFYTKEIK